MKLKYVGVALIAVCLSLFVALTQGRARTRANVGRGQYLVEEIAQCGMCHTPRNERGEFEPGRWLRGGPLEFEPAHAAADWPTSAPAIAGLPGWSRAEAIRFLQTGTFSTYALLILLGLAILLGYYEQHLHVVLRGAR